MSLRTRILGEYIKDISKYVYNCTSTDLCSILAKLNSNENLYYAHDYIKMHPGALWPSIVGLANIHYWDLTCSGHFFRTKPESKPTDAMVSLLQGPTMCDCGNAIQISIYLLILNTVGKDKFNTLFKSGLCNFIITQFLYEPIKTTVFSYKNTTSMEWGLDLKEQPSGNPLYFICDNILNFEENNMEHNDILYIAGVATYKYKHLTGFGQGWNVICYRPKPNIAPKYIGFGSNIFYGPKTMQEMAILLIDEYNKPQTPETLAEIKRLQSKVQIDLCENTRQKIKLAELLKNDTKTYTDEIGGIQSVIRVNNLKLRNFLNGNYQSWYENNHLSCWSTQSIPFDKYVLCPSYKSNKIDKLDDFSIENKTALLGNYIAVSAAQKQFLQIFINFALEVVNIKRVSPIGLIANGNAGIGKTHLSIGVAKFVSLFDCKVLFVDSDALIQLYQKYRTERFEKYIENVDCIILDDMNSIYGTPYVFLQQALEHVLLRKKAILVSSNSNSADIHKLLPYYINYNDDIRYNFLFINENKIGSYRKVWTHVDLSCLSFDDRIQTLDKFNEQKTAGIIVTKIMNKTTIAEIIFKFQNKYFYKITKPPIQNNKITDDFYFEQLKSNHLILISVNTEYEIEQLCNLIQKSHNIGLKIVVVTNSIPMLNHNFELHLSSYDQQRIQKKIIDRTRIIFPQLNILSQY